MRRKETGFYTKLMISISVLLLVVNFLLGYVLVSYSRTAIKTQINNRMLDISKTAADMLDGDVLEKIKKEDKGTEPYQKINNILDKFQKNINLKYIYCVRNLGNKKFVFTIDPATVNPGEFGEPVVYTDALFKASQGNSAVDETPYQDDWGRFYSAYSPVFNSSGKVAGIVAVDFGAEWFETQLYNQTYAITISCIISLFLGLFLVFFATNKLRKQLFIINSDISDVMKDVKELTKEINYDLKPDKDKDKDKDKDEDEDEDEDDYKFGSDIHELSEHISIIKKQLQEYLHNLHTQANSMINALSSEYHSIYYIDLDKDEGVCYQPHSKINDGLKKGEHFPFRKTVEAYAHKYIIEKNLGDFLKFADIENLKEELKKNRITTIRYIVNRNGKETYEMAVLARIQSEEDKKNNIIRTFGAGFTDVDEEMKKTLEQKQAISDALKVAESANKAKTTFLSNMSHEMRTPMNAIIGLNSIALNDPLISSNTKDYLVKIDASAKHLLGLINDILDMSRIEAGKTILRNEKFSLSVLLKQINVMIESQCHEKGLNWELEYIGEGKDYYIGDSIKLKQILINILSNSVKFTPEKGNIKLTIKQISRFENKTVFRFTIKDSGIGMSKEFLPNIFKPFSQENIEAKNKYGSTGLGMSITKNLVDMMNGDIKVESEKNVGTTFIVTLTLTETEQPDNAIINNEEKNDFKDSTEVQPTTKVDLKGRRILLAEDMAVNAEIMFMILKSRQLEVEHAENGKIAVEMFASHPENYYDAILMDMRMPEMDGLEATIKIRAMDRADAKYIPIIALTANAFVEDIQRSLQAGLNAHLSKPIEPDVLFNTLEKYIKKDIRGER